MIGAGIVVFMPMRAEKVGPATSDKTLNFPFTDGYRSLTSGASQLHDIKWPFGRTYMMWFDPSSIDRNQVACLWWPIPLRCICGDSYLDSNLLAFFVFSHSIILVLI